MHTINKHILRHSRGNEESDLPDMLASHVCSSSSSGSDTFFRAWERILPRLSKQALPDRIRCSPASASSMYKPSPRSRLLGVGHYPNLLVSFDLVADSNARLPDSQLFRMRRCSELSDGCERRHGSFQRNTSSLECGARVRPNSDSSQRSGGLQHVQ